MVTTVMMANLSMCTTQQLLHHINVFVLDSHQQFFVHGVSCLLAELRAGLVFFLAQCLERAMVVLQLLF